MTQSLTGTRIRDRRLDLGIRQGDLARLAGISPSYLNLIEHNRRRIAGRVLHDIARALDLDAALLAEGVPESRIAELDAAAAGSAHLPRHEESAAHLASRFPGWARLVVDQARQIAALNEQVAALSDRTAHDPELQSAVHEVLSVVTSIRSSASILVGGERLDRDWEERFYRNIFDDSRRLADSSQALVTYLESPRSDATGSMNPRQTLNHWLDQRGHHIAELEVGGAPEAVVAEQGWTDPGVRALALDLMAGYLDDARALPLATMSAALERDGPDPAKIAGRTGAPLVQVMRRLASLPPDLSPSLPPIGLVVMDVAGDVRQLKTFPGFEFTPTGSRCPLWPIFTALTQPLRPILEVVALPGEAAPRLTTYAVAQPDGPGQFDRAPRYLATMIAVADAPRRMPYPVGRSCSVCPRADCDARSGAVPPG